MALTVFVTHDDVLGDWDRVGWGGEGRGEDRMDCDSNGWISWL